MGSEKTAVLDHGYVKVIRHWGNDEEVIEAARMSTGKGFLGWGPLECQSCGAGTSVPRGGPGDGFPPCPTCKGTGEVKGDEKLLAYLWTHAHHTPFEMAGLTLEVQAPIFVFREWHRHRTQSYNELSARYTPVPDVHYMPSVQRCNPPATSNRQAHGAHSPAVAPEHLADLRNDWLNRVASFYDDAERLYQQGLMRGVPKEVARIVMPVGRYSRMRASANLRNWLGFLKLRTANDAQWEIRQYAEVVSGIIAERFPRTHALTDLPVCMVPS